MHGGRVGSGSKHLVLIETASNQRTIFQTNRLRENIGASQLIHQVGTVFVADAIKGLVGVTTIIAVSGKAILLTDCREDAECIIARVTERTLRQCPGVTARGVYVAVETDDADGLDSAIKQAHQRVNEVASELPSPVARFARLPFVEACASSAYPARKIDPDRNLTGAVSEVVLAKRRSRRTGMERIAAALPGIELFKTLDDFEDEVIGSSWVGIVHADGNGLGQVFLDFKRWIGPVTSAEDYIKALSALSVAIDAWTKAATGQAILDTWGAAPSRPSTTGSKRNVLQVPVIPVVMGGDDLTVICQGERAVLFAEAYLRHFEAASAKALEGVLGKLIPKLAKQGRVAAAAGVAIVKSHFPFHRAYELAEELTKSAKIAKEKFPNTPCSALDFQVVFDSSVNDLDTIRGRMTAPAHPDRMAQLTMRPYVVTPLKDLTGNPDGEAWAKRRHFRDRSAANPTLLGASLALSRTPVQRDQSDEDAALPRSQAYGLQAALYQGADIADGRLGQIEHRYGPFPWSEISVGPPGKRSLFVEDGKIMDDEGIEKIRMGAYLLDAMELADMAGAEALDGRIQKRNGGKA
jgi:hypothetical protein